MFPLNYLIAKRGCYAGACKNYCLLKIGPKRGQHLLLNMSQNICRTDICTAHHISLRSKMSKKKNISREAMSMSILHTPVNCGHQIYMYHSKIKIMSPSTKKNKQNIKGLQTALKLSNFRATSLGKLTEYHQHNNKNMVKPI